MGASALASGKREIRNKTPAEVAAELATMFGSLTAAEQGVPIDDCEVWVRRAPRAGMVAWRVEARGETLKRGQAVGLTAALEEAVRFVCLEREQ